MIEFLNIYEKPAYYEQALFLYKNSMKYLDDDYAMDGYSLEEYLEKLVNTTLFYVIVDDNRVCGCVYLDNIIGDSKNLHSAEITACIDKNCWGVFSKICAILFLNFCFEKLGFKKIKALVYPENYRVKTLLEFAGFEFEALLKGETIRNNKLQDIEIYSCRKAEK